MARLTDDNYNVNSQCRLCVDSSALALSAISLRSALPSNRMSMASCLLLSRKLFCIVRVAERAASPACDGQRYDSRDNSKAGVTDSDITVEGPFLLLLLRALKLNFSI